jgi:hypothetical protein
MKSSESIEMKVDYLGIFITKSTTPIIWLDTLAVIEIYKTIKEEKENPRIKKLFNIVREKVSQGKLICPLGEQEEEIEEKVGEVIKQFVDLSLGISFLSNDEIKESQLIKAIKSYSKTKDVELTYLDAFHRDPVTHLKNKNGFIFSIVIEPTQLEINTRKIIKQKNIEELQSVKDEFYKDKEFASKINDELNGHFIAISHLIGMYKYKKENDIPLSEVENLQILHMLNRPLSFWNEEQKSGLSGYLDFLKSNDYKQLPYVDINARMVTDLFTSKRKSLEIGDPTDISNLSTLLPYCDYVLTDRDQMNRIKRLGLDKKYDTKVFALSNINDLFSDLEKI